MGNKDHSPVWLPLPLFPNRLGQACSLPPGMPPVNLILEQTPIAVRPGKDGQFHRISRHGIRMR
jgi:hypothetical protein